jgi:hypothetical protein
MALRRSLWPASQVVVFCAVFHPGKTVALGLYVLVTRTENEKTFADANYGIGSFSVFPAV